MAATELPAASSSEGLLAWLAAATVVLFLAKPEVLKIRFDLRGQAGTSSRMVYGLATDLFQHLQNRSLIFHGKQRVGDLVKRVTSDCGCVKDLMMQVYLPIITSVVTLISMLFVMWQLSPVLTVFALVLAVPLGLTTKFFAGPMSERVYQEQELQGELMALAEQTMSAVPVVQAFGREATEDRRFRGLSKSQHSGHAADANQPAAVHLEHQHTDKTGHGHRDSGGWVLRASWFLDGGKPAGSAGLLQ